MAKKTTEIDVKAEALTTDATPVDTAAVDSIPTEAAETTEAARQPKKNKKAKKEEAPAPEELPAVGPVFRNMQATVERHALSLRKIAAGLDLNYNMLLKAGKKPVEGQAYNPEIVNWEAVAEYIARKADFNAINWDEIAAANPQANVAIPPELTEGAQLTLRGDDTIYKVAILTGTHVVLLPTGESTQPRLFSNATFMHQGPKVIEG